MTITDSHIPLTGLSNFWFPPNVDFHSGQQQQFLRPSQEPLVYTPLPRRHIISASNESNPNISSHDHRSFSPFMGQYSRQASSGTRSDR